MNADLNDRLSRLARHLDAETVASGHSMTAVRVDEAGATRRGGVPSEHGAGRPRRAPALAAAAVAAFALIAVAVFASDDSESDLRTADDAASAGSDYIRVAVTAQVDPAGGAALEGLDTPFEAIPRAGVYQISFSLEAATGDLATARVGPWQTDPPDAVQPNVLANQQGGCETTKDVCNVDLAPLIEQDDWNIVPLFFDGQALPLGTTRASSVITFTDGDPVTMTVRLDVSSVAAPPEHEVVGTTTSTEPTGANAAVADCESRAAGFMEPNANLFLYLYPETSRTEIEVLLSKLEGNEHVRSLRFDDQAEMLGQFRAVYAEHPDVANSVTAEVLPSLVQVGVSAGEAVDQVISQVEDEASVREVLSRDDVTREQADQCQTLSNPGRILSPSTTLGG
ncbi:MAG: permease-like cell division protein FtsX [Acidimicrobiia bacterium]|jgi:hypothetical protein